MSLSTHLTGCVCDVSFRRYRPLKLPLSCEVVQKGGFGGPIWILNMHFQIAVTSECVADFGSIPFSELGYWAAKEKKERKKKERKKNLW